MVKSARVQIGVQGDDIEFLHQVVSDTALLAHAVKSPVTIGVSDIVKAFYPAHVEGRESVEFEAIPVGGPLNSLIKVLIPKVHVPAPNQPINDSTQIKAGEGQTVRIEITRAVGGLKETYYLHKEFDMLVRGFPSEPAPPLNLT